MAKWDHDDLMDKSGDDPWEKYKTIGEQERRRIAMNTSLTQNAVQESSLISMVLSRMRASTPQAIGLKRMCIEEYPSKMVVFVVLSDHAVIVEDDPNLFPSDAFITKLRLIAEQK